MNRLATLNNLSEATLNMAHNLDDLTSPRKFVIAIDGPPGSGKTEAAESISEQYGITPLTSGMLFCASGMAIRQSGYDGQDPEIAEQIALNANVEFTLTPGMLPSVSINGADVSDRLFDEENKTAAAKLGNRSAVREHNESRYRELAQNTPLVVDRGVLSFPDADLKVWLTANPELRAYRRHLQLLEMGIYNPTANILEKNTQREFDDATKKAYGPTLGSLIIDTTKLTLAEVHKIISSKIESSALDI